MMTSANQGTRPTAGPLRNNERNETPVRYFAGMKLRRVLPVFAAVALTACTAAAASASSPGLTQVRDPGRVTGTIHGHCSYRDKGELPDPKCTPGSIDPVVTQANIRSTICKGGWTDPHLRPPESQTVTG